MTQCQVKGRRFNLRSGLAGFHQEIAREVVISTALGSVSRTSRSLAPSFKAAHRQPVAAQLLRQLLHRQLLHRQLHRRSALVIKANVTALGLVVVPNVGQTMEVNVFAAAVVSTLAA